MAMTPEEIEELAKAPLRSRTDEGTVQERSADDLIKLNEYAKQAATSSVVPWGMKIARTRPPGTV